MAPAPELQPWQDGTVIWETVQPGYKDEKELSFHGSHHPLKVRAEALELVSYCLSRGLSVDMHAVQWSSLGHDQYYWLKPGIQHDARSREEYSAVITEPQARELGAPESVVDTVGQAIRATELGIACQTTEDRIVRRADLWTLYAGTARDVIDGTLRMHRETRYLTGDPTGKLLDMGTLTKCAVSSFAILSTYNEEDMSLFRGELDSNGLSPNLRAAINIAALQPGLFEDLVLASPEFRDQIDPATL